MLSLRIKFKILIKMYIGISIFFRSDLGVSLNNVTKNDYFLGLDASQQFIC